MNPKGFCETTDRILLEQHSPVVTQTLWVSTEDPVVFCVTQRWHHGEGEEATLHLMLHELAELSRVAHDYTFSRSASIQDHEDRLDAQERHNNACGHY